MAASAPRRRLSIIRPGVVFGPGDYGNMTRLVKLLFAAVPLRSTGRSDTKKGCIYVTDLAELIVSSLAAGESSEILHAVYPEETSIRDIVQALRTPGIKIASDSSVRPRVAPRVHRRTVRPTRPSFRNPPAAHPEALQRHQLISTKRLVSRGWKPQFTLEDAFRDWRARQ